MNFFTQEAVVCPYCHAVYALGQFTRRELNRFGRQAQLHKLAEEEKMLARVQTLFVRYPKLPVVHAQYSSVWAYRGVTPIEEWLYPLLPEAAEWNFTHEECEVLEYLSSHFSVANALTAEMFTWRQEKHQKLTQRVTADPIRCRHCRRDVLRLEAERLNAEYTLRLTHLSDDDDQHCTPARSCLPFFLIMELLGLCGLNFVGGVAGAVCSVLAAAALLVVCLLISQWAAGLKFRMLREKTGQEAKAGLASVFRGRYYADYYMPSFAWAARVGKSKRSCYLFSASEDGWDWLTNALEGRSRWKVSAVFDLEFRGVVIGTGTFGGRGNEHYLVEMEEVLSAQLVSINDGSEDAGQLLRSANGGLETPVEQLVRPAEMQD